jgi:zinc protease
MITRRNVLLGLPASAAAWCASAAIGFAQARRVQTAAGASGIPVWLVQERATPLVALRFGLEGGSAQDPNGKEGLTAFLVAMMQEGGGELTGRAFKARVRAANAQLSYSASRDRITGGVVGLASAFAPALDVFRLALTAPNFLPADVERVRAQLLVRIDAKQNDSQQAAREFWFAEAFAGHPYGRDAGGTKAGLAAITADDLAQHHRRLFARDRMRVVVVGDFSLDRAVAAADTALAALPRSGRLIDVARAVPRSSPRRAVIRRDQPLASAVFGLPSVPSGDADHLAALVLNHILGSGDFDARLVDEIRVKRGLTYAIRSSIVSDRSIAIMLGEVSTRNETIRETLDVVAAEFKRMARFGPTDDEVATARNQLIGGLLLGNDGNAPLADTLVGFALDGHGEDELERRRAALQRVTTADIARLAAQMLDPARLLVTIVGNPGQLEP